MYTKEDFLAEAEEMFGNRFDYSEVEYLNKATPVKIRCIEHDLILHQAPHLHLCTGCTQCNKDKRNSKHILDIDKILRSGEFPPLKLHRFESIEEVYLESSYGIVKVRKESIMRGHIPTIKAAVNKTSYFINKAKEVHGSKYNYSEVKYGGTRDKVKIFCNICEDYFMQNPDGHLRGAGCHVCGIKKQGGPKGRGRINTPPKEIDRELLSINFGYE